MMNETLSNISLVVIVLLLVAGFAYTCVDICEEDDYKTPVINKVEIVEVYEYCDTSRYCDCRCKQAFCARLRDSVKEIDHNLRCANCGAPWGRHKTYFEWTLETQPYHD